MLERFFVRDSVLRRLRRDELGTTLDDVAAHLEERGHARGVACAYLFAAGHFSHWLTLKRIPRASIDESVIASFINEHLPQCRCTVPRGARHHMHRSLERVLAVLRAQRVAAPASVRTPTPVDRVLESYRSYLLDIRGVSTATWCNKDRCIRQFLNARFGSGEVDLTALGPKAMIDIVLAQTKDCTPGTASFARNGLRSFFRFAHLHGLCGPNLAAAIPRVAHWRRASLPRALTQDQLDTLLKTFDPTTSTGRRDYAMAVCMVGLGLRTGDVASLSIDDLDWRSGTLRLVRGKERRASLLPLPALVGRALVDYLRHGRPRTQDRHVFVRHALPKGQPLGANAVTCAIQQAFRRSGLEIPHKGAHVLRHTAATRMVRGGASLKEIADVLRHRCLETTMIYAKVDVAALAEVAMPWPGVQP